VTTNTTALPMPIKCVAPFAGGKRRLAKRIVELLGPHDTYVEPFVGGCSILPVKPRATAERVYDLNKDVTRVLWGLMTDTAWILMILRERTFSREAFDAAVNNLAAATTFYGTEHVADLLTVWWMGPGGIAGTKRKGWFAQRHTKTGGCPAKRWASFLESVPALGDRVSGVGVFRGDSLMMLEDDREGLDRAGTVIYCDPPYLTKSFQYVVDFKAEGHTILAETLNRYRRARVVVSYYDDGAGTLARLYPPSRWRRIEVQMSKNMSAASGATGRAVEVLLVNDVGK